MQPTQQPDARQIVERTADARPVRVLLAVAADQPRAQVTAELGEAGCELHHATNVGELTQCLLGAEFTGAPFELLIVDLELEGPPPLEPIVAAGGYCAKVILISDGIPWSMHDDAGSLRAVVVDRFTPASAIRDHALMKLRQRLNAARVPLPRTNGGCMP